ncbi:uncharacterized protein LOC133778249 [Humulus lupulus]|uniref:uncharacterized protein LOC133778249 n=1 Tax=Humulus lupulus TaxID=3486 RepID=UPI002B4030F5|nr:uncharacterized protein LOC133778249 [Humulus lupulus]
MDVDIKGAILVLDEAHNMEDIARDAGSVDIGEEALHKLKVELGDICQANALVYRPLYEVTQGVLSWIDHKKIHWKSMNFNIISPAGIGDHHLQ